MADTAQIARFESGRAFGSGQSKEAVGQCNKQNYARRAASQHFQGYVPMIILANCNHLGNETASFYRVTLIKT